MQDEERCEIARLITRPADVARALEGRKTSQRRNQRYADPGECWELAGVRFEVRAVYRQRLGEVGEAQARDEGYASLAEYREAILAMHPGMPWIDAASVWVHEFRRV